MAWIAALASVAGGVYGANQAGEAGDAGVKATKRGIAEQQRQYNTGLNMLEPQRFVGYQALDDLARLYGYGMSGYQPVNMLMQGGGGNSLNVKGSSSSGAAGYGPNPSPFAGLAGGPLDSLAKNPLDSVFGGGTERYGGSINALAGTVDVKGKGSDRDAILTHYLRTGEWTGGDKGKKYAGLRDAADSLRAKGWTYDPATGAGAMPGTVAPRPAGERMDPNQWLQNLPGYQFVRDEGQRDIGNSFAAKGGASSGNALKDLVRFNQGLAGTRFDTERNALFNLAGMGQTATNQAIGVGQNTSNNMTNLYGAQGDARASGVMGSANSLMGGINAGANTWTLSKYLQGLNQGGGQQYSQYGPWASGYRFGG